MYILFRSDYDGLKEAIKSTCDDQESASTFKENKIYLHSIFFFHLIIEKCIKAKYSETKYL